MQLGRDRYLQVGDKAQPNGRELVSHWPFSGLCSQAGGPATRAPHSIPHSSPLPRPETQSPHETVHRDRVCDSIWATLSSRPLCWKGMNVHRPCFSPTGAHRQRGCPSWSPVTRWAVPAFPGPPTTHRPQAGMAGAALKDQTGRSPTLECSGSPLPVPQSLVKIGSTFLPGGFPEG